MTAETTPNSAPPSGKCSPWRTIGSALGYFLFYLAVQYLCATVYVLYLTLVAPDELNQWEQAAWVQSTYMNDSNWLMIVIDLILLGALILWFALRHRPVLTSLGLNKSRPASLPLAFVAGIGLSCVIYYVMLFIDSISPELMESYNNSMEATYNLRDVLPYTLAGVIGAPLIEELFFRHLIGGRLARVFPRAVAILISSTVFGMVHGHPLQMIYAGVLGLIMSCVYFAYDSIWVSALFHLGFNAVSLLSFIDTTGMSNEHFHALNLLLQNLYMIFTVLGIAALILLFLLRTRPVFGSLAPSIHAAEPSESSCLEVDCED